MQNKADADKILLKLLQDLRFCYFYHTGRVQIIGRNSRFIGYFVTKNKTNTEIQGLLKLYQTVYFLSRNSMYKLRKSGVLWPLLLLYFPLTSHSIIGSSVSMSVKHKLLHWYCTLLSENPSFSYNSPLVNQKNLCVILNQNIQWIWQMKNGCKF